MPDKTKIEWADATWNVVTGCSKVSPGCNRCYAERIATSPRFPNNYPKGFDVHPRPERLLTPTKWKAPRAIFVNSMSDLFHRDIPAEFLAEVWDVMARQATRHTYLILTKRAHRMAHTIRNLQLPLTPNIWLGFSAENQKFYDSRIHPVIQLAEQAPPGQIFFVSCEPLLGPIDLRLLSPEPALQPSSPVSGLVSGPLSGPISSPISWIIAGGESGPGATPMDLDWARSLRDQAALANVPFFLKQLGGHPGKRGAAQALLDGQTHLQMPVISLREASNTDANRTLSQPPGQHTGQTHEGNPR